MPAGVERSHPPAMHYPEDELPHELILSIERVLDIRSESGIDSVNTLTNDFNAVNVLNGYFPNGVHHTVSREGYHYC